MKASGVVLSSRPILPGSVAVTINWVGSSEGETAGSLDVMVATASGARTEPAGMSVPVKTWVSPAAVGFMVISLNLIAPAIAGGASGHLF